MKTKPLWYSILVVLCSLLSWAPLANANKYALLVGVSEYPNLGPELSLQGPKYDVQRAYQTLRAQGFSSANIQLLADGVHGAELPTKANIFVQMQALAKKVKSGDFVYLHFSGHGSQEPSMDFQTETDGMDEIFLPRDVQLWDNNSGEVPNSLKDDEVKLLVDAIRDQGADVWLIFDSCHSGTMSRSITDSSIMMRNVSASALGIPDKISKVEPRANAGLFSSHASEPSSQQSNQKRGDLIAFYAAQSTEEAPEMALPQGQQDVPQGLFSFVLTSIISQFPNITYKQLAQVILLNYNSFPWYRTTPLFEGENLDQAIFGSKQIENSRFAVTTNTQNNLLKAGVLHGFEQGAIVNLYADPLSETPVAQVEVIDAQLTNANLSLPKTLNSGTYYADLAVPAMAPPLKIKWLSEPTPAWQNAVQQLAKQPLLSRTTKWVASNQAADLNLYAATNALYVFTPQDALPCFIDATGCDKQKRQYKSHPLNGDKADLTAILSSVLVRSVRALNLMRLSARIADVGDITSFIARKRSGESFQALDLGREIIMHDGDELRAEFVNTSAHPLDLTILFIDSLFGITQIYPEPGTSGRLMSGEMTDFEGQIDASSVGNEQFMLIATPVNRDDPPTSLLHLQQPALDSAIFTRAAGSVPVDIFSRAMGDTAQDSNITKVQSSVSVIRWKSQ